jgi:uncharacterized protein YjeT (DUF2065 family)
VFNSSFVCSQRCYSRNWSVNIPQLTTSYCLILWTMYTSALVDHRGYHLWTELNWSYISLCTLDVQYILGWLMTTSTLISLHCIAFCILLLVLEGLLTMFECVSWIRIWEATLSVSQRTILYVGSCFVQVVGTWNVAPDCRLNSDQHAPYSGVCRVSKVFKFPGRFGFQFHPKPDSCNRSYHMKDPAFQHPNFAFNWVFKFWLYHDMMRT